MEQPKIERLLHLIRLMTGPRRYTTAELARSLQTSERTVYRYIDSFRRTHWPVSSVEGCPRLDVSNAFLQNFLEIVRNTYEARKVDCFCQVDEAIRSRRQLLLEQYASANSHTVRDRLVEPFAWSPDNRFLIAYDVEDGVCKIFVPLRAAAVRMLDTPWQFAESHRPVEVDLFGNSGMQSYRVRWNMGVRSHNYLLEQCPMAEHDIIPLPDMRWALDTEVFRLEGPAHFYMANAEDIEIVDSPELKEYVRRFVEKWWR